jgi:peptidoglycan/LPS O-acetylase OafA/YrhL
MSATLEQQASGSITRGLKWLDSKLSRVTSSREFIPEVDGLRFVAIFFVILFHSAVYILAFQKRPFIVQHWEPGKSVVLGVIGNLYLGVQIFFVISGLAVALPFARAAIQGSPRPSFSRYFMRRLTRIEPPYILALLAMYYLLGQYRFYLPHLLAGLLYAHVWIFVDL